VYESICVGGHFLRPPPLATLWPPLKTPFLKKNIDTFFKYVNLNLCNFLQGGAQLCQGGHNFAKGVKRKISQSLFKG